MQASLVPKMALMRLMPDIAEQPLPGCALVARRHRVVEVKAPRALHEIAPGRCHVAQLLRRAGQDRAREQRISLFDQRVVGEVGVRHQRPDEKAAVQSLLDVLQRQLRDVDQPGRVLDIVLHQVDQIGAARDELRGRIGGDLADGVGDVACA